MKGPMYPVGITPSSLHLLGVNKFYPMFREITAHVNSYFFNEIPTYFRNPPIKYIYPYPAVTIL